MDFEKVGIQGRFISRKVQYFIYGVILGVVIIGLFDYGMYKEQKFTLVFAQNRHTFKQWNRLTKIRKEKVIVAILVRFPKLNSQWKTDPTVWEAVNNYAQTQWNVTMPRPTFPIFEDRSSKHDYGMGAAFYIEYKQRVHKALLKVDYKELDSFWPKNLISSDPKLLQKNWDTMVLQSLRSVYGNNRYDPFKKAFLGA